VRSGETWCGRHGRDAGSGELVGEARGIADAVVRAAGDDGEENDGAAARARRATEEFRRRLEDGDYRGLYDRRLSGVIAQAAAERSLDDEIGALRFVLARLLAEEQEQDAAKLAASVARVVGVAVQAARAQRAIGGELADGLTEALTQILAEFDS
jgi:hypothetical protein